MNINKLKENLPTYLPVVFGLMPLLLWFVYQARFFAKRISTGLPPDELHHYYLALFYQDAPGMFLTASEKTYHYGAIDHFPYLYHLVAGKLLALNFFNISPDLFLRYLSIAFSAGAIIALWNLMEELKIYWPAKILVVAAIVNIPMFVYISSSISYDNLINLLAILMQLYLIKFLRTSSWQNFFLFLIFLFAGSLIKVTFLPFYLLLSLVFLFFIKRFWVCFKAMFSTKLTLTDKALALLMLIFLAGNFHLYAGNYINYGSIIPSFEKVEGVEIAKKYYPQYQRDISLIETKDTRPDMTFSEFAPKYFTQAISTIYGIMGHKSYSRKDREMERYYLTGIPTLIGILVFLIAFFLKKDKTSDDTRRGLLVLSIVGFGYIAVLLFDNYNSFQTVRVFGYSLQGRYMFPVLANILVFCGFFSFYKINKYWLAVPLASIIAYIYFKQGFIGIFRGMQKAGFF